MNRGAKLRASGGNDNQDDGIVEPWIKESWRNILDFLALIFYSDKIMPSLYSDWS